MVKEIINLYSENTYIINEKKSCYIIDPGAEINKIKSIVEENEYNVLGILLTHGHFDHIYTINEVYDLYKCPVYIHEKERDFLFDPNLNLSSTTLKPITFVHKDSIFTLKEGDTLPIENEKIRILETPGHTRGSVSYIYKRYIFTGDTLFKGTIGRFDLPTSNKTQLFNSLKHIVKHTRNNTVVYPGHGIFTTISQELHENLYLKQLEKG